MEKRRIKGGKNQNQNQNRVERRGIGSSCKPAKKPKVLLHSEGRRRGQKRLRRGWCISERGEDGEDGERGAGEGGYNAAIYGNW